MDIVLDLGDVQRKLDEAAQGLEGRQARSLWRVLAGTLEAEVEANFAASGRPSWVPLSEATKRKRLSRNKGKSVLRILQDSGLLARSVFSVSDDSSAGIGVPGNTVGYAAIHQYGGTIERPAHSVKTRLRTDARGALLRQGTEGSAKGRAVFAKDSHKRVQEGWGTVDAYSINIPARPFLPFAGKPGSEVLQPETGRSLLAVLQDHLAKSLR